MLESHDVEGVGEASNGREAVALAWALKPDMILMDPPMPEMDGLEATKRLTAELPSRERDVLERLAQGTTSNRGLAEPLGVTENTVEFHMRNILEKLNLQSRTEVVAYALRHRLVDAESDDH